MSVDLWAICLWCVNTIQLTWRVVKRHVWCVYCIDYLLWKREGCLMFGHHPISGSGQRTFHIDDTPRGRSVLLDCIDTITCDNESLPYSTVPTRLFTSLSTFCDWVGFILRIAIDCQNIQTKCLVNILFLQIRFANILSGQKSVFLSTFCGFDLFDIHHSLKNSSSFYIFKLYHNTGINTPLYFLRLKVQRFPPSSQLSVSLLIPCQTCRNIKLLSLSFRIFKLK